MHLDMENKNTKRSYMASLALIVSLIFLAVILSGPLALTLYYFEFKILSIIMAAFAMLVGGFWLSVTPFPVSSIGLISFIMGAITISKYLPKI